MACPVSLMEWFLQFYDQTQKGHVRPVEGIVQAGEVLFVPRGWWHLAMNLEVRCGANTGWQTSLWVAGSMHICRPA